MGIPQDQCDSIFEDFSQVKGQKYSTYGGTGLGLAITKRLLDMMNGAITVSSEVDIGSAFEICIKDVEIGITDALFPKEKQIECDSVEFGQNKILITDDIEYNRELIKGFLEDYKFILQEAENGAEAIEKVRNFHPDLILLDMKMPEMNGYEAASILKNDDNLKQIPIIAVTASAMKKDEEIIKKLCDSYLRKPISKADLISVLIKYLPHTITMHEPETIKSAQEKASESTIIPPPEEEMQILYDMAMRGNMNAILEQANSLEQQEAQYGPFTGKLRKLAKDYQDEELLIFIGQYIERHD